VTHPAQSPLGSRWRSPFTRESHLKHAFASLQMLWAVNAMARNHGKGTIGRHVFCQWRSIGGHGSLPVDGFPAVGCRGGMGQQKSPSKDFRIARTEMLIPPG
jgi:hypothetical protein